MGQLNSIFTFRGKLGNAVGMKGQKGKINVRSRVIPNNPKTDTQMTQRAALATASQVASVMYPIIGQSFENKKTGGESRNAFVKQFINDLNANWDKSNGYVMLANPRHYSVLQPSQMLVSKGTLPSVNINAAPSNPDPSDVNNLPGIYFVGDIPTGVTVNTYCSFGGRITVKQVFEALNLSDYDNDTQFTQVVLYKDDEIDFTINGEIVTMPICRLWFNRVVFHNTNINDYTDAELNLIFSDTDEALIGKLYPEDYNITGTVPILKGCGLTGIDSIQHPVLNTTGGIGDFQYDSNNNRAFEILGATLIASDYEPAKGRRSTQRLATQFGTVDLNITTLETWKNGYVSNSGTYYLDLGNKTTY